MDRQYWFEKHPFDGKTQWQHDLHRWRHYWRTGIFFEQIRIRLTNWWRARCRKFRGLPPLPVSWKMTMRTVVLKADAQIDMVTGEAPTKKLKE